MDKGRVVAYCGDGIGKTSAALGNGIKAAEQKYLNAKENIENFFAILLSIIIKKLLS